MHFHITTSTSRATCKVIRTPCWTATTTLCFFKPLITSRLMNLISTLALTVRACVFVVQLLLRRRLFPFAVRLDCLCDSVYVSVGFFVLLRLPFLVFFLFISCTPSPSLSHSPRCIHLSIDNAGFDVYNLDDQWLSIFATRDGGGYGQVFYGGGCSKAGWVLFPTTNFLAGGSANMLITGEYWEQGGRSYPGPCSGACSEQRCFLSSDSHLF